MRAKENKQGLIEYATADKTLGYKLEKTEEIYLEVAVMNIFSQIIKKK